MRMAGRLPVLVVGARHQPTTMVALFHGLGGNRHSMEAMAERWSEKIPKTLFVLYEAPGADWFRFPKQRDEFNTDGEFTAMIEEVVSASIANINAEIDLHLTEFGLPNHRLVVAGFSQGAAISAYAGLSRACLGCLPLGGPCPPRPALLPQNDVTRVCVVTGDKDPYAPHEKIVAAFSKYAQKQEPDGVHIIPGQAHIVSPESEAIGLRFLQSCGCE